MWIFKMYFQDDGEFFEYDPLGMQGAAGTEKALPYLESLLSFLELNSEDWEPLIQQAAADLERFLSTGDPAHTDRMMQTLGELSAKHIYFQLLYLQWFAHKTTGKIESRMAEELRLLPAQLTAYRKQAQRFLERILDIDQVGREVRKNMRGAYLFDSPREDAFFRFEPTPISLGVIRGGDCGEVLFPNSIRDLIDFSLRECVRREISVRRCRSCGRYFPIIGRITAEYCSRPSPSGSGRKAAGATKSFKNTAGSTSAASLGSRLENSRRSNLLLGTKPPRPGRRTVTERPSRWMSLRSG